MQDDPEGPEQEGQAVHEVEIRKISDDEFGLVLVTNPDPKPEENEGLWIQMDRDQLAKIVEDGRAALEGRLDPEGKARQDADELEPRKRVLN